MAVRESQVRYNQKNIKRVPLDMQKEYYENVLKPFSDKLGMSVNTFIKEAIQEKIERHG